MNCVICQKPMPADYEPRMCCSGLDCNCGGQPIEPVVCSNRCYDAVMNNIGIPVQERRAAAGIPLYAGVAP